jgi:hypothetical protein
MRIEGSNLAAANLNFQVSFQASLFLQKVRAEEKESKNLFVVYRENPLITHSTARAVAVRERQEEEKKKKRRGGGIIQSINLMCVCLIIL